MAAYREEYLYEFPSFPGLSLEERRRLTYTTMLLFYCTNATKTSFYDIEDFIRSNIPINPVTQSPYSAPYFGPYKTTLEEFLLLPEIACVVFHLHIAEKSTGYHSKVFQSFMNVLKEAKDKYYNFRFCIVQAFKAAGKNNLLDKMGTLSVDGLCKVFNSYKPIYKAFEWKISKEGNISFLDDKPLLYALCTHCSRELVIRSNPNRPITLRLRNHPDYLMKEQIESERVLAEKAVDFYFRYRKDNPENIEWEKNLHDYFYLYQSSIASYPSYFNDNVYAALHYCENVRSFRTLSEAITKYTQAKLSSHPWHNLTRHSEFNLLLNMVALDGLAPLKFWDEDKVALYMGIVEELTTNLNGFQRSFLFDFLESTLNKPEILMSYSFWSLNKMTKHIFIVTRLISKFLSGDEIAEAIKLRFKYDIKEWLLKFDLFSVDDLIEKAELRNQFCSICVKHEGGIYFYRNMECIMFDQNLCHGFPFTARKRLLNCLQEAKLSNVGKHGFVNEKTLNEIYYFCYKRYLDATEKVRLFGKNYDTVYQFWEEYDCNEITVLVNDDDEYIYGINEEFKILYDSVLAQKKKCYESLKFWMGVRMKDLNKKKAGPQSNFTVWKQSQLSYETETLKAERRCLARRS